MFLKKAQPNKLLPTAFVLLALWMLALGVFLWPACQSSLPPICDSIGYMAKGKNLWDGVFNRWDWNFLAVPPTFRPPGTVLMSYPFGYSEGTQGVFFRSIFIPACLFGLAVFFVTSRAINHNPRGYMFSLFASICGTTLPLFFQFYMSKTMCVGYWGLVDGFIGSVAAVSMALLVASFEKKHFWWRFSGLCLAGFCIYIKPTGLLVFGFCAGIFFLLQVLISLRNGCRPPMAALWAVFWVALAGLIVVPAFLSPYLGAENLETGSVAVDMLKSQFYKKPDFEWFAKAAFHLMGWIPTALLAMGLGCGIYGCIAFRGKSRTEQLVLFLCACIWFVGGLFFLMNSSFEQVRYAFPFWLPAIVCIAALAARSGDFFRCKPVAIAVVGLVVIHAASLMDQLTNYGVAERPSVLAGWSMRDGQCPELEPFREWLSSQASMQKGKKVFFNTAKGAAPTLLCSAVLYDAMVQKLYQQGGFYFEIREPNNWKRPSGIYYQEFVDVDFILTNTKPLRPGASLSSRQVAKLQGGLAEGPVNELGLVAVPLGADLVIYEVVDRGKFLKWLEGKFPVEPREGQPRA